VAAGSPILVDGELIGVVAVYTDITELRQIEQALRHSEARYRSLFEDSPISLWQEDWSRVKTHIDSLRKRGVTDFRAYFEAHREEIAAFGKRVVIRDVNKATLRMYDASSKRKLIAGLEHVFLPETAPAILEDLLAVAEGRTSYEHEVVNRTLSGERKLLQIRVRVLPGAESTWNQVAVSVVDITDQRGAEQALAQSLRQKETLLREVHHRVKNNLQVVSSLLYLQALRAEPLGASDILHESRNQVQSMALVHEKLYGSEDFAQVDLRDYLQSLVTSLLQFHHNASEYVQVVVDVPEERLDVDRAMPCGLIVNELVSNALKHAFPDGRSGQLVVHVTREGSLCRLSVKDDGVGLPADLQPDDPTKLGLQLVRMLVEQLHGILEVRSADGAEFRITFAAWQIAPGEDDAP
jgi:two-component sensor histidine kinase/PAS domain-containing protein